VIEVAAKLELISAELVPICDSPSRLLHSLSHHKDSKVKKYPEWFMIVVVNREQQKRGVV
jgi:hypothetical protein